MQTDARLSLSLLLTDLEGRPVDSLDRLRSIACRALIALLWFHVLLNPVVAAVTGGNWMAVLVVSGLLAAAATGCLALGAGAATTHTTIAVALVGTVSILLSAMAPTPWQVDTHLYYFAALALLATLCDWRAILAATAATAIHHLSLNFLFPAFIYPGGSDLVRVVLHAVILLVEAGALVWLTLQINMLFIKSSESVAEARAALLQADVLTAEKLKEQAARDHRQSAMDTHTQDFGGSIPASWSVWVSPQTKCTLRQMRCRKRQRVPETARPMLSKALMYPPATSTRSLSPPNRWRPASTKSADRWHM
jgi:methyl-accepting chemotaxis protein